MGRGITLGHTIPEGRSKNLVTFGTSMHAGAEHRATFSATTHASSEGLGSLGSCIGSSTKYLGTMRSSIDTCRQTLWLRSSWYGCVNLHRPRTVHRRSAKYGA